MQIEKEDQIRKVRHGLKSHIENLRAAISLHGDNDGMTVDNEDTLEVKKSIKIFQSLWEELIVLKSGEDNEAY